MKPTIKYLVRIIALSLLASGGALYLFSAVTFADHTESHQLEQILEQARKFLQTISPPSVSQAKAQAGARFTRSFAIGSRGDDVAALQQVLAQDPSIYPEGLVTGYFGPLTQEAVKRFQEERGIVNSGAPETTGYGAMGPRTRAALNQLAVSEGAPPIQPSPKFQNVQTPLIQPSPSPQPPSLQPPSSAVPPAAPVSNLSSQSLQFRKTRMLSLAKENPQEFLNEILLKSTRDSLPANLKNLVEREIDFTTKIDVLHEDDFKNRVAKYFYFLRSGTKRFQFYPDGALPPLRSGTTVRIKGFQLENFVVASVTPQNFQIIANAAPPISIGVQKTAVLLINFLDSPSAPVTPAEVQNIFFNGQVQKYYQEQSYGKLSWSGDVYGWYMLSREGDPGGNCQVPSPFDADFQNLITANNINLAQYTHLVIVPNHPCGASDSSGTITITIDKTDYTLAVARTGISVPQLQQYRDNPFNWTYFDSLLSHELGHNLGVLHANSWECGAGSILYGECIHQEYGNWFDVMGVGDYALHFNALYKDTLKWLDTSSLLTITGSGRYTLPPFENSSGARAAKIQPTTSRPPFYLEYRQPIGFDANLNDTDLVSNTKGLMVNWNVDYGPDCCGGGFSPFVAKLLDMSPVSTDPYPGGSADWKEVTLNGGTDVFKDPGGGITIGPVVNADTSGITFDITIGKMECVHIAPTPLFNYSQTVVVAPGGSWFSKPQFKNNDTSACEPSDFKVTLDAPVDWKTSVDPPTLSLAPGKTGQVTISFDVPVDASVAKYKIPVNATNLNTKITTILYTIDVDVQPPVTVVAPNGGENWERGKMYDIKWKAASSAETKGTNPITIDLFKAGAKVRNLFTNITDDSVEPWTVPADLAPADDYKIGITFCPEETKCYSDLSDKPFSIVETTVHFVDLKANSSDGPLTLKVGDTIILDWTSQNVVRCASVGSGPNTWPAQDRPTTGTFTMINVQGIGLTTYVLQCFTADNTKIEDKVEVTVIAPPQAVWTQITREGTRTTANTGKSGHFQFFSENEIYVLGGNGQIYKWTAGQNPSAQWEGPLTSSEITDTFFITNDRRIHGLGLNGAIYRWDGGSWTQITREGARTTANSGKSGHFDIVDGFIYALGGDGAVYRWPVGITSSPNPTESWQKVTADGGADVFKRTSDGTYYILGQNGAVYRMDGFNWTQITRDGLRTTANSGKSGHFQFFSENEIYGLGSNGLIYKWTAGQNTSAQWEGPLTPTGEVNDVFYLTSEKDIYGLGLNGAVYRFGYQGLGLERSRTHLLANILQALKGIVDLLGKLP